MLSWSKSSQEIATLARQEIHLGDIGTIVERTIKDETGTVMDISGATDLKFYFQKPDGTDVTVTAVLSGAGTDGKMRYVSLASTWDQVGRWQAQARIQAGALTLKSDVWEFHVYPNLQ